MKVIIFGATGMLGQGVLRECLLAPDVERVLAIGRSRTGVQHPKLHQIAHADLWHYEAIETELRGYDACFFCLGVTSAGMKEADYERVTYGIATAAADILCRNNPGMTFVFVSGAGADTSERGRIMWARIKGKTENAILRMPCKSYVFRPGVVQPVHGARSRTAAYRVLYSLTTPLLPLLRRMWPGYILTTEQFGRAMLAVARHGAPKPVLESSDINALAPV
ncbi:MAG: epimerase [Vicinamibacterales bacterium]